MSPNNRKNEELAYANSSFGGAKQIRTAVAGFADLCLAPRP